MTLTLTIKNQLNKLVIPFYSYMFILKQCEIYDHVMVETGIAWVKQ